MNNRLLIVAASARPWILSAQLAGMCVDAFDFFGDWDSCQFASSQKDSKNFLAGRNPSSIRRIASYSELFNPEFKPILDRCDTALICGGFELQTELVESLADRITVLGPSPKQLARVSVTPDVFEFLNRKSLAIPATKTALNEHDDAAKWLRKTCCSSGGSGVGLASDADRGQIRPEIYYQAIIAGDSVSATLVSFYDHLGAIRTELLAVTRQLVGVDQFGASQFGYCGSLGNLRLPEVVSKQMARVGETLAQEYKLVGLWGIDFVLTPNGPLPVDINPRLTASMELLEQTIQHAGSTVRSIVGLHLNACRRELDERNVEHLKKAIFNANGVVEGKAILFNRSDQPIRICGLKFAQLQKMFDLDFFHSLQPGFSIADVPREGQCILPGRPILTLRVRASDDQVFRLLQEHAERVYQIL